MSKKNFSVSITAAHHAASRLAALAKGLRQNAMDLMSHNSTRGELTSEQMSAAKTDAGRIGSLLSRAQKAFDAESKIRTSMREANSSMGITVLMGEIDTHLADLKFKKELLSVAKMSKGAVHFEDVAGSFEKNSQPGVAKSSVSYRLFRIEDFANLEDEVLEAEVIVNGLKAELSAKNAAKIDIEIDVEMARVAGLS